MTALVLLFLVSPGESDAAVTLAMRQAAIQVLGPATAIVIRDAPDGLSDLAAIEQGDALHAVVVVRLAWMSRGYLRATLRLHLAATAGWISREVAFEPKDAAVERGRALGYSVAAVVAGGMTARGRPADGAATADPRTASLTAPARPAPEAPGQTEAVATTTTTAPTPIGSGAATERFLFLDATGVTSTALGGSGGQARLGWAITQRLRVVVGGGGRVGTIGVAHASFTHLYLTAGAALNLLSFGRIAFACRGEGVLVRQSLSHFSDDDAVPVKLSRWIVGFRPQFEVSMSPSRLAAIIASGGWELTTGSTDIYVRGVKVAVVPAARLVAELGLRVHF